MQDNYRPKPGDRIFRPRRIKRDRLRRVLGIPALFSAGYGNVGSSIYYALGIVAVVALGATPIALGIAGILFIFTALTYAEGTAMFPEAGGSASFARHGFNDLAGFIAGWALMLSYIVTISISAFTIPPYLGFFWEPFKVDPVLGTATSMGI
ncbi:MAG: amino acid permease, partial [Dehalococcoidia bacterium]